MAAMTDRSGKTPGTKEYDALKADADLQTRIGSVIRACRRDLGITQEELAWRADLHRTYIADIERGARNVTLRTVGNVATALQINMGKLFAHVTAPQGISPRAGREPAPKEVREILLVEHGAAAATTVLAFSRAKLANPIRIVNDGKTGLNYLFRTGRYANRRPPRPQLIMLVLGMPGMSGLEFMRRVRRDERTRAIPVILLSVAH